VAGLAVLVLWAPWPFASVTPWAWALLATGICAAFALALLTAPGSAFRPVAVPAAALVGLAVLGLAQSLPWPAPLAEAVSPGHVRLAREAGAALDPGARAPEAGAVALSVAPRESRRSAATFAVVAAALAAAAAAGRLREGRRLVGAAVLAAALAQVAYGAPRWVAGAETVWGVAVGAGQRLQGTFVNPNHFALYLEMALALAFAWGWWAWGRAAGEGAPPERRVALVALPTLAWLTLFAALAFTGSRAGLVAALVGVVAQGALLALRRGLGRRGLGWALAGALAGAVVAAAGLAVVAFAGFEAGLGRLAGTSPYEVVWNERIAVYRATWELWQEFPWLGTGLGTFLHAFPLGQRPAEDELLWRHAHSDPLELLAVAGGLGGALLLVGLAAVLLRLLRLLRHGRRREDRAAGLAVLGALVAVGIHELADFGLTMPANALTLAALVGAAMAAPYRERSPEGRTSTGPGHTRPPAAEARVSSSRR
jgi:O-antigen ligase